jgi:glucose-6-phosphate 1-dehydrogenase
LLLDALLGDATLFIRWDEVERAWEIMDPLVERWRDSAAGLAFYDAGSWGPPEADDLLAGEGRSWRRL